MVKISLEEAIRRWYEDKEVYLLYDDGTEALVEPPLDNDDLNLHYSNGGEFGYEEDDSMIEDNGSMIHVDVYADTTGQYTEDEIKWCNCTSIKVPKEMLINYFNEYCKEYCEEDGIYTFDSWYHEFYTCDDTEELYEYCVDNGFTPTCGKNCNDWTWY